MRSLGGSLPGQGPPRRPSAAKAITAQDWPQSVPSVRQALIATVWARRGRSHARPGHMPPSRERVKIARHVLLGHSVAHRVQRRAVCGTLRVVGYFVSGTELTLCSRNSCSGWYTDQSGQPHCFNCPNRGTFQQGWSPVGATNANQCIAAAGALSSCTASAGQTCRTLLVSFFRRSVTLLKVILTALTGGSSPSGLSRRNVPLTAMQRYCRGGYKSCLIYGVLSGKGSVKSYECIDIDNDLESCGGCVSDDSPHGEVNLVGGRDCSAIPNIDAVRCQKGVCVIGQSNSVNSRWSFS